MKPFVHLHTHTEYSLLDGAAKVEKIFERCRDLGMPAVAITDHGNMFGAIEFYKEAVYHTNKHGGQRYDLYKMYKTGIKYGVKPIFGCEVYVCPDHTARPGGKMPKLNHLVLLAKNHKGYENLVKLVSKSFVDGFYYKPRIDFGLLSEYSEGLIALSACLAGEVPQALLNNDYNKALETALRYKALFGEDYYIELQDHRIEEQKRILPKLIELARDAGIKTVATNDVHYLEQSDSEMQRVLQCISYRTTIDDDRRGVEEDAGDVFSTREFYLKSGDEMAALFAACPEAVTNTLEIADKCDGLGFVRETLLPIYTPPNGMSSYDYLRKLTHDGLNDRYGTVDGELDKAVLERAEFELEIIERLGFVDYFLIVWDFIDYAERSGIPVGPGRGSGVGSIVAYATGITKVDPLKYDLIFERFLNSERVSSPDFDIDFCVDGRDEVISYVVDKYGADRVAQIITFGTMAAKAAIKDVARVYNVPYSEVDRVTKLIPNMSGASIAQIVGIKPPKKEGEVAVIPDVRAIYQSDEVLRRVFDMAMQLEGLPRQSGMHAAGVVICRDPISDHVPLAKAGDDITTQFDMIECEELGLLKMDFLGLRTLTDIRRALELIKETKGITIDFYNMIYDDRGVFELIGEGDTHAVFQLESGGMKSFMRDLRPDCMEDVIAGIALYRPGPMDSIPTYVRNKRNPRNVKYDHPILEPILAVTYGCIVYQEQVMRIVREMGGYTLGRADIVRRMMSKKKKDEMEREEKIFLHGTEGISGALANGVSEQVAKKVFGDMTAFAEYAFNKSHAAAYAYLSYQTAYLKKYYPVEFLTAVLNNRISKSEDIQNYLGYLKGRGIKVLPPDINKSSGPFTVEDDCVRVGLTGLKSVGEAVISEIISERDKGGRFEDLYSFLDRLHGAKINKRQLESLVFAGAFDSFGLKRSQLVAVLPSIVDRIANDRDNKATGQFDMFDMLGADSSIIKIEYPEIDEYGTSEKLQREKEVAGIYLSGHPLDSYREQMSLYEHNTSMIGEEREGREEVDVVMAGMLVDVKRRMTKKGNEMGLGRLEDLYGAVELMVPPFRFERVKTVWTSDTVVAVKGKLNFEDGVKIWVESVTPITVKRTTADNIRRKVGIRLTETDLSGGAYEQLIALIEDFPGPDEVYICRNGSWGRYVAGVSGDSPGFLAELYGIVSMAAVEIK